MAANDGHCWNFQSALSQICPKYDANLGNGRDSASERPRQPDLIDHCPPAHRPEPESKSHVQRPCDDEGPKRHENRRVRQPPEGRPDTIRSNAFLSAAPNGDRFEEHQLIVVEVELLNTSALHKATLLE